MKSTPEIELKWLLTVQAVAIAYQRDNGRGYDWLGSVVAGAPKAPVDRCDHMDEFGCEARAYVVSQAG